MSNVNIFEQASRLGLLFATSKGNLTVTDLWQLPLTTTTGRANLNEIAQELYANLQKEGVPTFVPTATAKVTDSATQLKFDIVKHIIDIRLAEETAKKTAADKKTKKDEIMVLIQQKKKDDLGSKSVEELYALLEQI